MVAKQPNGAASMMPMMEHRDDTIAAPAFVSARAILNFEKAVLRHATTLGMADRVRGPLADLRMRLENLTGLATLVQLATAGHPHSLSRVVDELDCLARDFAHEPLTDSSSTCDSCEDWPGDLVLLSSAIDLFVGAALTSKDRPDQRDRFVIAAVRAIEDAAAFPVTYAAEAATYLGEGDGTLSLAHARLVIASATQRLMAADHACSPRLPRVVRHRLECMAVEWMRENPVDAMFEAVAGPRIDKLVLWETPERKSCVARPGDWLSLVVREGDSSARDRLAGCGVLFAPRVPAAEAFVVASGMQVRVPEGARTGPVAIVKIKPDFARVQSIIARFDARFPLEWAATVFQKQRMDTWALVDGFGPPIAKVVR